MLTKLEVFMKILFLTLACFMFYSCDDDDPITQTIYGCTDSNACNFNSNANIFDDTCTYAEENYNCEGDCINPDYDCEDLEALQSIIDENNLNIAPLELGCSFTPMYETTAVPGQTWQNGRLKKLLLADFDGQCPTYQQISIVPDNFGNLTELDTLLITNSQITTLPESFGNLTKLSYLNLNYNLSLTALPESISNCENLRQIVIEKSGLELLPENIGNLQNLEKLYIYGNQLTTLPQSICNLPSNCAIEVPFNKICKMYQYECIDINITFWTQGNWTTQDLSNCCDGPNGEQQWITCP